MAKTMKQASFGPELFEFLAELRENNNREWFAANKDRYEEDLLEPALDFVNAFAPRLERISPHFRADARPSGGSVFRIYRDTRFSKDKSPYKTNLGIHFRHERAKDAHAPGYYLHIGPSEVFAGGGIWHPGTEGAARIREAIVADPERWRRATRGGAFARRLELGGDSLKRVPSWAAPEHPLADDLKRKDFFAWARLSEEDVVAPGFLDEYTGICRTVHLSCSSSATRSSCRTSPKRSPGDPKARPHCRGRARGEIPSPLAALIGFAPVALLAAVEHRSEVRVQVAAESGSTLTSRVWLSAGVLR